MGKLPGKIILILIPWLFTVTFSCLPGKLVPTEPDGITQTIKSPLPTNTSTVEIKPTRTLLPVVTKTPILTAASPVPTVTSAELNTDINPLTGLEVEDPETLNRRPIAVKVQLFPRGQRPPWGISKADIVFDYYQNNGVTRLTAVFYGDDAGQVGPIRSARLFDLNIIKMYKAFFVFGLADWRIYDRLQQSAFSDRLVVEKYGSCPPLCRIDPDGYNHLVLNTNKFVDYFSKGEISSHKQDITFNQFDEFPPQNGIPADRIYVRISYSAYNRWDFDASAGQYLRFQDSLEGTPQEEEFEPLLDQLTEEQIASDNVVILFLAHRYAYQTRAGAKEVFNIKFTGNGKAKAFRDGQMYNLHWSRDDSDAPINLTFPDGTPYSFRPGKTWFQLVGKASTTEEIQEGIWRFEFKVP
jgi:hypothetical protein